MSLFSEKLDIYDNYTRGELCDLLGVSYTTDIERGVYKPASYSSILFFSTINNRAGYINGKISDTEYIYSANSQTLDQDITQNQFTQNEMLLFVRMDQETGFYYFGPCTYTGEYYIKQSRFPLYCLKLLKTKFSDVKVLEIPNLSN